MASKYSSISSKVQSDAWGSRGFLPMSEGMTADIRKPPPYGLRCHEPSERPCGSCRHPDRVLLEQVAEHREDLRGRHDLLHGEVDVGVTHAGVLLPQVLVLVGDLHVGE